MCKISIWRAVPYQRLAVMRAVANSDPAHRVRCVLSEHIHEVGDEEQVDWVQTINFGSMVRAEKLFGLKSGSKRQRNSMGSNRSSLLPLLFIAAAVYLHTVHLGCLEVAHPEVYRLDGIDSY